MSKETDFDAHEALIASRAHQDIDPIDEYPPINLLWLFFAALAVVFTIGFCIFRG